MFYNPKGVKLPAQHQEEKSHYEETANTQCDHMKFSVN